VGRERTGRQPQMPLASSGRGKGPTWLLVLVTFSLAAAAPAIQQSDVVYEEESWSLPPELEPHLMWYLYRKLAFLRSPLPGARVPRSPAHLPGAPRPYRQGIHQGIDFVTGDCGVPVTVSTPVRAAADGLVIRADHDYQEMSPAERQQILSRILAGDRDPQLLDRLHGRQVWLLHRGDVLTRYSHLSRIPEDVVPYTRVRAGQLVGYAGNSGTSYGTLGSDLGVHLHWEIFVRGRPFWWGLRQESMKALLQFILEGDAGGQ